MTAHHQAANRMFKTNSEKLQRREMSKQKVNAQELAKPHETTRTKKPAPKRLEKGDYAGLRLETAKIPSKGERQVSHDVAEDKLSFSRDRKQRERERTPQERELKDGELSFSRSRSAPDLSRGR